MKRFNSIRHNSEYRRVYENGRSRSYGPLVMYILENDRDVSRLGVSISKKRGNSVERHTFVRRMREIFRLNEAVSGFDIIVVARNRAEAIDFDAQKSAYVMLLKKHGIFKTDIS